VGEKLFFVKSLTPGPGTQDVFLLGLQGVDGREAAETLKGQTLLLCRDDLGEEADSEDFLLVDLEGLEAVDTQGQVLGTITSVSILAGRSMAHLGRLLIPLDAPFLTAVDFDEGRAYFDLPEGLLESQQP